MSLLTNIVNTLGALVDDFLRSLRNGRSSDALLAETVDSMQGAFGRSYDEAKSAGGEIEVVSLNTLAQAQSAAQTAHLNVKRAVRDSKNLTGTELTIQQNKIVKLQEMANHADEAVKEMQGMILHAKENQVLVEGKVAMSGLDMKLREGKARTDVALEKLYNTMERVSDSQLRAAGYLDGSDVKDHSAELSRRMARSKGRAESAQRMVSQTIGDPFAESLSSDEMETLKAAYESAGVAMPAESVPAEQAASK